MPYKEPLTKQQPSNINIYTNSSKAIRNVQHQLLENGLHCILIESSNRNPNITISLRWIPGHAGVKGNDLVHQWAHETNIHVPLTPWPNVTPAEDTSTYKKQIAEHYQTIRENHSVLSKPYLSLAIERVHTLRRVQTNAPLPTNALQLRMTCHGSLSQMSRDKGRHRTHSVLMLHCHYLSLIPLPSPSFLECLASLELSR